MAYKKAMAERKREVAVSEVFINEYMPDANGNYVKVYLLGLNQCMLDKPMNHREMADKLSLMESDVIRAWSYWAEKGVVVFDGENVEFADLTAKKQLPVFEIKPTYTPDEIFVCARANKELADMFSIIEKILQKPLSSTDLTVIFSLYDYYRLSLDVIPMLITYCVKNNKKSMRQIEKTAATWVDKGISTVEDVEIYLKRAEEYSKAVNKLKNAMGVIGRNFSPTEMKCINSWLFNYKMSFDMIVYAYDICITNTGKLSVKYMDKVLENWHTNGILTIKQAKQIVMTGKSAQKESKAAPTKFTNFDQREFDYDAFEKGSTEGMGNK